MTRTLTHVVGITLAVKDNEKLEKYVKARYSVKSTFVRGIITDAIKNGTEIMELQRFQIKHVDSMTFFIRLNPTLLSQIDHAAGRYNMQRGTWIARIIEDWLRRWPDQPETIAEQEWISF